MKLQESESTPPTSTGAVSQPLISPLPTPEVDDKQKNAIEIVRTRYLCIIYVIPQFFVHRDIDNIIGDIDSTISVFSLLLIIPVMREHEKSNRLQRNVGHNLNPQNMH